jgi:hypothetical protein
MPLEPGKAGILLALNQGTVPGWLASLTKFKKMQTQCIAVPSWDADFVMTPPFSYELHRRSGRSQCLLLRIVFLWDDLI